jgi:hypothetical protein
MWRASAADGVHPYRVTDDAPTAGKCLLGVHNRLPDRLEEEVDHDRRLLP